MRLGFAVALVACLAACGTGADPVPITIDSPMQGALFPRDMVAPTLRWHDDAATHWRVSIAAVDARAEVTAPSWRPPAELWERIKEHSLTTEAVVVVEGLRDGGGMASRGSVTFRTSADPVQAPIFYRQVPLPFSVARARLGDISWRLGWVSTDDEPRTVLTGIETCANCHSFSADGSTLAMDVDYGSDKGTYAFSEVAQEAEIRPADLITWRDFDTKSGHRTFGLLSRVSPDGRHAISTVKERSITVPLDDPFCSQLFFPVSGILGVYDRTRDAFFPLAGADDSAFCQTNPEWSPDGTSVVFARETAYDLEGRMTEGESVVPRRLAGPFLDGDATFRFDLFRLPFNDGAGGTPEPIPGAADNGRSNFFARHSPDGRWIVFCQADSFMFNQPDSALYIMPAAGGEPRRLGCNAPGRMNSWHSWSPNGKWLAFASKRNGPFTQIWLTHIDGEGNDSVPVVLEHFLEPNRAANLPEFVNLSPDHLQAIALADEIRYPR